MKVLIQCNYIILLYDYTLRQYGYTYLKVIATFKSNHNTIHIKEYEKWDISISISYSIPNDIFINRKSPHSKPLNKYIRIILIHES